MKEVYICYNCRKPIKEIQYPHTALGQRYTGTEYDGVKVIGSGYSIDTYFCNSCLKSEYNLTLNN